MTRGVQMGMEATILGALSTVLWVGWRRSRVRLDLSLAQAHVMSPVEGPERAARKE
ncbi:MAG: hypothetical protein PVG71_11315 [Anaerolineae bacterium]